MDRRQSVTAISVAAAFTAGLGLLAAGCGQNRTGLNGSSADGSIAANTPLRAPEGVPEVVRATPHELAGRLDAQLLQDAHMQGAHVMALVDKTGIATLTGFVRTPDQRSLAVVSAWGIPGIHGVNSKLEIRPMGDVLAEKSRSQSSHTPVRGSYVTMSAHVRSGGNGDADSMDDGSSGGVNYTYGNGGSGSGQYGDNTVAMTGYDAASASRINPNSLGDGSSVDNGDDSGIDTPTDDGSTTVMDANGNPVTVSTTDPSQYAGVRGNTIITKLGRAPGVIPQNAGSYFAGTHSTEPR